MVLSIAAGNKLSKATRNRNQVGPATAAACFQLLGQQHFRSENAVLFHVFFIGVLRFGWVSRWRFQFLMALVDPVSFETTPSWPMNDRTDKINNLKPVFHNKNATINHESIISSM
jgi:hypothetical protein